MATGTLRPSRIGMQKFAAAVGLFLLAGAVGLPAFVFSGLYDVTSASPHFGIAGEEVLAHQLSGLACHLEAKRCQR